MLAEEEAGALLTSVVTVLGGKVLTAVIVLAVVGVLLIAGYIVDNDKSAGSHGKRGCQKQCGQTDKFHVGTPNIFIVE